MNGAFAMRLAGARVRAALASTVSVSLAAVESGAVEGTDIGGFVISSGIGTFTNVLTNDAGGKVKLSGGRLVAGATPTDYATAPTFAVSGTLIFDNSERVAWSATVEVLPVIATQPTVRIYPSAAWTGVANSGFTVANGYAGNTPPADPTRVTAKPAQNQLEYSGRRFVADYDFGLRHAAKGGIQKVIVHCEGNRFEIPEETVKTIADPRGGDPWKVVAHWVTIDHALCATTSNPSGNGQLNIFFEVVANDTTMQRRVQLATYYRATTLYDYQLTVAPSLPEIAGSRYQTVPNAVAYLAGKSDAHNNLITAIEDIPFCDLNRTGSIPTNRKGRTRLQAAPGKTLTIARPTLGPFVAPSAMTPKYPWFEFYQDTTTGNLIIDTANFSEVALEGISQLCYGIKLTNSRGPAPLINGTGVAGAALPVCFFRFCEINNQGAGLQNCVCLYNRISYCSGDLSTGLGWWIGNRISHNSTYAYRETLSAIQVQYAAGGGTVLIPRATGASATGMTLTDPAGTASITFGTTPSAAYYYNSQVVAWINSRAGWTASVVATPGKAQSGDARRAGGLVKTGDTVGVSATSLLAINSRFEPHPDYRQIEQTPQTNVIVADNICYDNSWQTFQFARTSGFEDVIFINEGYYRNNDETSLGANISRTMKHVCFIHMAHLNSNIRYYTAGGSIPELLPDSYCGYENCVFESMSWVNTGTHRLPTMTGNHVIGGRLDVDTTSATGSSNAALFVDAVNGNFTPAGRLLTELVTPSAKYDAYGTLRAASDAKGPVAKP